MDLRFTIPKSKTANFNAYLIKLAEEAEKINLHLPKTILYQDKKTCAIRFGFGHLNEDEIEQSSKNLFFSLICRF